MEKRQLTMNITPLKSLRFFGGGEMLWLLIMPCKKENC